MYWYVLVYKYWYVLVCTGMCWYVVTYEGREQADHADGHHEAGPAVPVVCRRDEGKQNFPEDGQKVHHIVETRRQLLLPTVLIIIILT